MVVGLRGIGKMWNQLIRELLKSVMCGRVI